MWNKTSSPSKDGKRRFLEENVSDTDPNRSGFY